MISIVIPTFNESQNIVPLIKNLIVLISDFEYEIIVVDDDSPDGTGNILKELAQKYKQLNIIHRTRKLGLDPGHTNGGCSSSFGCSGYNAYSKGRRHR